MPVQTRSMTKTQPKSMKQAQVEDRKQVQTRSMTKTQPKSMKQAQVEDKKQAKPIPEWLEKIMSQKKILIDAHDTAFDAVLAVDYKDENIKRYLNTCKRKRSECLHYLKLLQSPDFRVEGTKANRWQIIYKEETIEDLNDSIDYLNKTITNI